MSIIATPVVHFDTFVKQNKIIYPYYYNLFFKVTPTLLESPLTQDNIFIYLILNIVPRYILLLIFVIDVFWLNKIEIFYYFIFLSFLPLLYRYLIYSAEFALEQYIRYLENEYTNIMLLEKGNNKMVGITVLDPDIYDDFIGFHNPKAIYHDEVVSIRKYIEIQAEILLNYDEDDESTQYEYSTTPFVKKNIKQKYREDYHKLDCDFTEEDYDNLHDTFYLFESNLTNLYIYIYLAKKLEEITYIKKLKLYIYIIYFICWLYILVISIHTLTDITITIEILKFMKEYVKNTDPFSDCTMLHSTVK